MNDNLDISYYYRYDLYVLLSTYSICVLLTLMATRLALCNIFRIVNSMIRPYLAMLTSRDSSRPPSVSFPTLPLLVFLSLCTLIHMYYLYLYTLLFTYLLQTKYITKRNQKKYFTRATLHSYERVPDLHLKKATATTAL